MPFLPELLRGVTKMKNTKVLKLTLAGILCAVAVVGSIFSFPV